MLRGLDWDLMGSVTLIISGGVLVVVHYHGIVTLQVLAARRGAPLVWS